MTSVRANVTVMTSTGDPVVRERMAQSSPKLLSTRGDLMGPILFPRHRSEQDDSDDGGNKVIGAVLKVHGSAKQNL